LGPRDTSGISVGAVTHEAIVAALPVAKRGSGFFNAVRDVNGMSYINAVIVLFAATF
jgi:hypothetical protein